MTVTLPVPAEMQGRSLVPLFTGKRPESWRDSIYYRYYHDPGHHDTRAHYGIRTDTHKLIHFWKKDQWELYDLTADDVRGSAGVAKQGPNGDFAFSSQFGVRRQATGRTSPSMM